MRVYYIIIFIMSDLIPEVELNPRHIQKTGLREGISYVKEFIRWEWLYRKHAKKGLNSSELDELMSLRLKIFFRTHPSIDGTFSPSDALARVYALPQGQRRRSLDEIRVKLSTQRKAWAGCRIFIEDNIKFNHDVPRERLVGLVETFGSRYGFAEEQKRDAFAVIDRYYVQRQRAIEIRQQFPDNIALIKKLSGVDLDTDTQLEVTVGPMSIDIFTTDRAVASKIYSMSNNPIKGYTFLGFASATIGDSPVYYTVTSPEDTTDRFHPHAQNTLRHEQEHIKNRLLREILWGKKRYTSQHPPFYRNLTNPDREFRMTVIEEEFKQERSRALEMAKDEIIATLYTSTISTIQTRLDALFFVDNGTYDYLGAVRNRHLGKNDDQYQNACQRLLVVEYRRIIEKAVAALAELLKDWKYTPQEAIALLTDDPLEDWPKAIKRLQRADEIKTKR